MKSFAETRSVLKPLKILLNRDELIVRLLVADLPYPDAKQDRGHINQRLCALPATRLFSRAAAP